MQKNVTIKDLGFDKIYKNLMDLNKKTVKVGLYSEDQSHDGTMNMAVLAELNERTRPFMTLTVEGYADYIGDDMEAQLKSVIDMTTDSSSVLKKIGETYVGYTKEVIDGSKSLMKPNAPETIERKGHDHPLIDSGDMYKAIKHKVVWKR